MSEEKSGTGSIVADINEFLKGPVEEYISKQIEQEPVKAEEPAQEAASEASVDQQVEQEPAVTQPEPADQSTEEDDDKSYNFRRLREQNQEYKSKLSELEQFKYEATAAFRQLYEQNQQLQQSLKSNPQVSPAADENDENLTEVEKAIRKQIKAINEPELKRIQELRAAEEARMSQVRAQELLTSAQRTVDDIINIGKVNLGPQTKVFKDFVGDLILNAADKYNVDPSEARDAFVNAFEMYHQAKKASEKAVVKSAVDQAKRVASPISKPSAAVSESRVPTKLPSQDDLKKQGYRGNFSDMLFAWQRDQYSKKR